MNNMKGGMKDVLHMENITMQFDSVVAVNGLTLDVNKHEIAALIGLSDVSRTTTFNCATGIHQPTLGSISFNGEVILADAPQGKTHHLYEDDVPPIDLTPVRKTSDQITKLDITRASQNTRLFNALTVFENVLITKHIRVEQNVFLATLRLNYAEEKYIRQESMTLLEIQKLTYLKDGVASPLPCGLQHRLEIARALATNPSPPLLGEPVVGMNPQETQDLTDFVHKIRDDYYLTIFVMGYHIDLIIQMPDHVCVLDFDEFIIHGAPGQI